MIAAGMHLPMLQRLTVRPIRADLALVSLRLPAVHLTGMWAKRDSAGRVRLEAPRVLGSGGVERPAFALQPGFAEQAAEAVAVLWQRGGDPPGGVQ